MDSKLSGSPWWEYLEEDLRELINQSLLLLDTAENWKEHLPPGTEFHDYSFVVFPAAKAYEGFLKNLFLDLGFITEKEFYGKRFRVGKALNPSLDRKRYKDESVYDKLVNFCGGKDLAENLWESWKEGRNLLFHWFPKEKRAITLAEAKSYIDMIINSMNLAFKECKIERQDAK